MDLESRLGVKGVRLSSEEARRPLVETFKSKIGVKTTGTKTSLFLAPADHYGGTVRSSIRWCLPPHNYTIDRSEYGLVNIMQGQALS